VHPDVAVLVEVAVNRHAQRVPHARDRPQRVRARPQMRRLRGGTRTSSSSAESDTSPGRRPIPRRRSIRSALDGLPFPLARDHGPGRDHRAASGQLLDLAA
jgi:hypothetical protein